MNMNLNVKLKLNLNERIPSFLDIGNQSLAHLLFSPHFYHKDYGTTFIHELLILSNTSTELQTGEEDEKD